MDIYLSEPSTLWAGGIYDTDESLNRELIERIYIYSRMKI